MDVYTVHIYVCELTFFCTLGIVSASSTKTGICIPSCCTAQICTVFCQPHSQVTMIALHTLILNLILYGGDFQKGKLISHH